MPFRARRQRGNTSASEAFKFRMRGDRCHPIGNRRALYNPGDACRRGRFHPGRRWRHPCGLLAYGERGNRRYRFESPRHRFYPGRQRRHRCHSGIRGLLRAELGSLQESDDADLGRQRLEHRRRRRVLRLLWCSGRRSRHGALLVRRRRRMARRRPEQRVRKSRRRLRRRLAAGPLATGRSRGFGRAQRGRNVAPAGLASQGGGYTDDTTAFLDPVPVRRRPVAFWRMSTSTNASPRRPSIGSPTQRTACGSSLSVRPAGNSRRARKLRRSPRTVSPESLAYWGF